MAAIQALADRQGELVTDVGRRFIRLGLLVAEVQADPDAQFIIKRGKKEREVLFL